MKVTINGKTIDATFVHTAAAKSKGLNGTSFLQKNHGMFFDFSVPEEGEVFMTMKNMTYPLDIIFLKDNKVVDFITAKAGEEKILSHKDFDYVLEVNPETFLHKYLKGSTATYTIPQIETPVPVFKKGGVLPDVSIPVYKVKVDDIPIDPTKLQILDKDGVVAGNVEPNARIFSREHTLALYRSLHAKDKKKLVETFIKAVDQQDKQDPEYVGN